MSSAGDWGKHFSTWHPRGCTASIWHGSQAWRGARRCVCMPDFPHGSISPQASGEPIRPRSSTSTRSISWCRPQKRQPPPSSLSYSSKGYPLGTTIHLPPPVTFWHISRLYYETILVGKAIMQHQGEHAIDSGSNSEIYERYAAMILAYVRLHTASWQDAEDLMLAVFLTALEHENLSWLSSKQQLVWLRRVA